MKNVNTNTVLQIIALIFLIIIVYMSFRSGSHLEIIKTELDRAREELQLSRDTLMITKTKLKKALKDFEKMKVQKDILIHKRDSLLFDFKKKNAKDWDELQAIKDSIKNTNKKIIEDKVTLDKLFGIN